MGSSQSQNSSKIRNTEDSSSNSTESDDSDEYRSIGSNMEIAENLSELTYDAAYTQSRLTFNYPSMDEILQLDYTLDEGDKISFIYLIYEDPTKACDLLQHSLDSVVMEWFILERQYNDKWHLKLIEVLSIIKHFKATKILGYNKEDIIGIFLPFNKLVSVRVNKIRKFLYCVFEDLHPHQVNQSFNILQQDLSNKHINIKLDKNNLELTFLQLEKSGYFSLIDLTNLINLFKRMDLLNLWEDFKMLQENVVFTPCDQLTPPGAASLNWLQSNSSFMNDDIMQHNEILNDHHDHQHFQNIGEVQEKIPIQQSRNREICNNDDSYYIDPTKPGLLLIINNEHFYTEIRQVYKHMLPKLTKKLEDRSGTKTDSEYLQKVFKNLNFNVFVQDNVTHDKIKEHIKDCIKIVHEKNYSCFFVTILSHGDKGVIYGSNSISVDICDIQHILHATSLMSKPKVLIIQACQGETRQRIDDDEYATDGIEIETTKVTSPKTADVLTFYATIPNYTAIRHLKHGTWFIQSLCEKMASNKDSHFEEICLEVKRDVVNKRWGTVVMVPLVETCLTKKLYLKNIRNKTQFSFSVESGC